MKRGMRRRKGISSPGQYPNAHAGQLRDLIYFTVGAGEVNIGPKVFGGAGKSVPDLLNFGGTATIGVWNPKTRKSEKKRATYKPRPFVDLSLPAATKILVESMEKFPLA